ncbi:MAG: MBOAT family protein [Flavobacteriales bacterium]|nr:MBOAT family protein [Flavobacteriales bacterium]
MEKALDFLAAFVTYDARWPINFIHPHFWIFFALVLAMDGMFRPGGLVRSLYLWGVSVFFYYKTSGLFFFLLLFAIHLDFFVGKAVFTSASKKLRLALVTLSVVVNLGILAYFKYAYFFTEAFNQMLDTHFRVLNPLARFANTMAGADIFEVDRIILPVGISFYTFQTISYTVDIYRGRLAPARSLTDFGFFVSFFPQLVAGPIMRASEFLPQIYAPRRLVREDFGIALFWILNGLTKKVMVGDYLAVHFVDRVFANPGMYTGFENMMAVLAYSLQVYCDFSGYTDIAYGVAYLMGFQLNKNFNAPYKAVHVADFWRRWHMSLSTFLRDYLYIPLGGNRHAGKASLTLLVVITVFISLLAIPYLKNWIFYMDAPSPGDYFILSAVLLLTAFGPVALVAYTLGTRWRRLARWIHTEINLMITMLVGGLWHGASWMFVIWGGLNGLGLMVHKLLAGSAKTASNLSTGRRAIGILTTFLFISFTRIFFRSPDLNTAREVMDQMLLHFGWEFLPQRLWLNRWVFGLFLAGMALHWLPSSWKASVRAALGRSPFVVQAAVCLLMVIAIYQATSAQLTPFIYFQF